jgi:ATP-dependent Clp protease ATP-binding subunit ClpC
MKFQEAYTWAQKYIHVIFLNRIVPEHLRDVLIVLVFNFLLLISLFLTAIKVLPLYVLIDPEYQAIVTSLNAYTYMYYVVVIILVSIFIFIYSLQAYSRYFTLASLERVFVSNENRFKITYESAVALLTSKESFFVDGLLSVKESNFIMNRLGITKEEVINYTTDISIDTEGPVPEYNATVTLGALWKLLYKSSETFKKEILSKKIQKDAYYETCDWLDRILEDEKRNSAWWWRENLSKTRGVAKELSYGATNIISKYARELVLYSNIDEVGKVLLHKEAVMHLEKALSRNYGANAVIVGSRGTGRHAIVKILSKMIDQGDCYAEIEHKRIFEFDNSVLGTLEQNDFVNALSDCFNEALIARNIIFVINDVHVVFEMAQKQGCDLFQVLERYIMHPDISLVCVSDQAFYQKETHKIIFDKDFEVIHIEDMTHKLLIPYIQDQAILVERQTGKFFPSHSINTLATALTKYFVEDPPLIKTNELMYKIATSSSSSGSIILDEASVSETIKALTGVSTGEIQIDEKEKLLNLEVTLHKKVIGQNEAIKAVASTMRRSRVGLVSETKPIGSFLFLGPTGVGKTETAKTLAEVFFGSENNMSRIDMNEYTMGNSSYRILGDENEEGDLARRLHSRPYGVLLLDEFEKATSDVKDIFLRVLDEGLFTNGAGKIISARTQIIIATSNAGSNYIRQSGLNPNSTEEEVEKIKQELLNTIISEGLFRPELINRFDAVVVFHPLSNDVRIEVAKKMLESLKQRALQQGYDIAFTDALVQKVLAGDIDNAFGGRAIQRNIQTEVEEALAKKIIEGSLQAGDTILLDAPDIQ